MGSSGNRIAVILNAGSGSVEDESLAGELREKFAAAGVAADIRMSRAGNDLQSHAEEALREGFRVVVAGGGDGTVSAVASVLAGTSVALGVLPLGTLNHFAKDAGIPLDPDAAVRTIAAGRTKCIDIGEVNGRTFINNSSLGIYPLLVRQREAHQQRGASKWWGFFRGLLTVLRIYPFMEARIAYDGRVHARKTPFVFIGNNEYEIHGLEMGTRASLDSGSLSVYTSHRTGRVGLLKLLLKGLLGRLRGTEELDIFSTGAFEVHLHTRRARVALDGEITVMQPPLRYRCRPGDLHVIVPADGN